MLLKTHMVVGLGFPAFTISGETAKNMPRPYCKCATTDGDTVKNIMKEKR